MNPGGAIAVSVAHGGPGQPDLAPAGQVAGGSGGPLQIVGRAPVFQIGALPVYGDLILAPMAGYCDLPFRCLCREYGSAVSYVPLILAESVTRRFDRTRASISFDEAERPVAVQLLGNDPDRLVQAARRGMELGPDLIDLNLGCPARKVVSGGRGAALLREPEQIARLAAALVAAVPVPVTAKIRLGWDHGSRNHVEVAHILEDAGVAAIAVHGRTRAQAFSGSADWDAIAEVRAAVGVPVMANGDVRSVADIGAILEHTGCPAAMIGRAAVGNPWIFSRREIDDVPLAERLAAIRRQLPWMAALDGEHVAVLAFRKHAVKYVQGLEGATALRPQLIAAQTVDEVLALLEARARE
jgi:tRNA-dihydrouridine synthase B